MATSNEWANLDTPVGFERCVAGTVRELYGYVALLDGRDRAAAERHVTLVYRSLYRAARTGEMTSVTLGQLRSAGRRIWLDEVRGRMSGAPARALPNTPVSRVAQLSVVERAVLVFHHVNGMTAERTARELGRDPADVAAIGANAVRRLRGTDDTSGTWLRAYFGPEVNPASGLVDRIVHGLADDPALLLADDRTDAPTEEIPATDIPAADQPVTPTERAPVGDMVRDAPLDRQAPDASGAVADVATSELPATRPVPATPAAEPPLGGWGDEPTVPPADHTATSELPATPARAVTPLDHGPAPAGGPRRWIAPVAVLAAAAILVGGWIGLRSGDDDTIESAPGVTGEPSPDATAEPSTEPTTGNSAPTSAPADSASTTAPTDTTTPPAPSTSVVEVIDSETSSQFSPTCTSTIGADDPRSVAMRDTFGPLGSEPAVVVDLPAAVGDAGELDPFVRLNRLGAGLLVALSANDQQTFPDTVLSYVGFDGTVGWTRCLTQSVTVLDRPVGNLETAIGLTNEDGDLTWYPVAFDDGAIGEPVDPVTQLAIRAAMEFGTADPDAAEPLVVWRDTADGQVLTGVDASGNDVWTDDTVIAPTNEGFYLATTGNVAVVRICTDGAACATAALRGYDLATGDVLWTLDGYASAPVVSDGYALVGNVDLGWDLIDATTGRPLDGQHWDAGTFETRCCAEGDYWYVRQVGPAVAVVHGRTLSIWLPDGVATGQMVSLIS